jgi:hypothetical protein
MLADFHTVSAWQGTQRTNIPQNCCDLIVEAVNVIIHCIVEVGFPACCESLTVSMCVQSNPSICLTEKEHLMNRFVLGVSSF